MRRLGIVAVGLALVAGIVVGGVFGSPFDRTASASTAAVGGKIYWTDTFTENIRRANLDGSGVEDLVTTGLNTPAGIALDVAGGKMYWTDGLAGKIQRANLNGTGVEDLITAGMNLPLGIALDVTRGKMYWTDVGAGKIQRANLDGSGVEDLLTGLTNPGFLALDAAGGKMYWTEPAKIRRANLDGSGVEDLVTTGLINATGVALDLQSGKVYWTDTGTDKIQRANLDGTQVEDLVTTGLVNLRDIETDASGGKMYWAAPAWPDPGTAKIQRANLDGSGAEDLITTGLGFPLGIALDIPAPVSADLFLDVPAGVSPLGADFEAVVVDQVGNPVAGEAVECSLGPPAGPLAVFPGTAVTGPDGIATFSMVPTGAPFDLGQEITLECFLGSDPGVRATAVVRLVCTTSEVLSASTAQPPSPPNRFYGCVLLDDAPAPGGTAVTSTIAGLECGSTTVQLGQTYDYFLDVVSSGQIPGCGTEGASVKFTVAGYPAGRATWHSGYFTELDLYARRADLVETSVSDPPVSQNRGASFSVTDTAKNQGGTAAAPSRTRYYLSTDTVRDAADKLLTGARWVPGLAPGLSSTANKTVTIPTSTVLGTYYLLACADDTGLVPESDETNNCLASAGTILVTAPDLVETAVSKPPGSAKLGSSFNVTDTAKNAGTGPAGASTTRYYLSLDKIKSASDVLLTGSRAVPALTPGVTSNGTVSVTVPATTPLGAYYLLACADDLKVVNESKEGNNCRASLTTVQIVP